MRVVSTSRTRRRLAAASERPGGALLLASTVVLACALAGAGCARDANETSGNDRAATWRADCRPIERPAPLSLEAAREAHRLAERRHELGVREAASPGWFLRTMHAALDPERVAAGDVCLDELADRGQLLFDHEYGPADGLGSGRTKDDARGPFRRVHTGGFGGPETISCPSCHWVGGPNGAGAETDNAFLAGDGDRPTTGDARNPPALLGLGVVEALAREMTRELHVQRDGLAKAAAREGASREIRLSAKGVDFGVLRASATGELDASGIRGIDPDLVVKPFGWKGTLAGFSEFADEALQMHIGIQTDLAIARGSRELLGEGAADDPDADGVRGELGRGPAAAIAVHLALLELPTVEPLIQHRRLGPAAEGLRAPTTTSFAGDFQRGRALFHETGCAGCHVPMLLLDSPVLELEGLPPIDLAANMQRPGLRYDAALGGYPVWLFSDLKRHDMGPNNRALHVQSGVDRNQYLTPRLWGVADSAPYLHDGRAPSLDYAISGHDGEGSTARAAYAALAHEDKAALRVYLMSLRRVPRLIVP